MIKVFDRTGGIINPPESSLSSRKKKQKSHIDSTSKHSFLFRYYTLFLPSPSSSFFFLQGPHISTARVAAQCLAPSRMEKKFSFWFYVSLIDTLLISFSLLMISKTKFLINNRRNSNNETAGARLRCKSMNAERW